ncbi:MAG: MFS transporter [Bacteroidales bacterium]|nr:MFS transporter [Bacteroidales bacterium]
MTLTAKISKHNFYAFLWHAGFLALAQNFMDVDTIIPAMLIESGGSAMHVGILTAIMLGGSSFTQIIFAPFLSNQPFKKKFLLFGINARVLALFALGFMFFFIQSGSSGFILGYIFLFISIFAFSGAFSNISYTDILGKSVSEDKRKTFFSAKQIIAGTIVLFSAFWAKKIVSAASFPVNYAYMFIIGGSLLLIASFGFWKIKEQDPSVLKISGIREFFKVLKSEILQNKKLVYFLGFVNTQGIATSFMPFVMLYAKDVYKTNSSDTGSFLLFKIFGVVSVSILIFLASKRVKYKWMLYGNVLFSLIMAIIVINIGNAATLKYLFILGGVVYSLYSISMNGVLLEVSGHQNRAMYTGFTGAGNILPAIFPLLGGWIISQYGYNAFFGLFMIIVSFAFFFIYKIDCKK